ncbi:MAG: MoaD/ThiS family protein [Vicinamibacterales bacterium]|nr:MoaD/ThiS family protein [Vicinamibacterales bacterium]
MAHVRFTANIQRHVACPPEDVEGATLGAVLDAYFVRHPAARGYVLDDQGRVRKHMAVFIGGRQLEDRRGLADPVGPDEAVDVVQSLSGGATS